MVLSNKKLKQTLRAAKAELITASGAENNFSDKKHEKPQDFDSKASDSLRTILNLEAQRSRFKRAKPKRVKQSPSALTEDADTIKKGEISGVVEHKIQEGLNSDAVQVEKTKKKKEKRKRDESEASEKMNKKRKKKKNKRPRQWWLEKKKNKEDNNNKTEEVEDVEAKAEGVNRNESGSTKEQFVAKADESIHDNRQNLEMSQKVYVGGIPYYSTEDDIRSYFESCGTITSIDCMTFPDTGKFRGIAIITFKTEAAAKRALALDGSDMGGLFLKIQPFKSAKVNKLPNFTPPVPEEYNRIYVGNLSWDITENDLRNILADCTIKSIRFGEDKETGEFKGYAHVDLADSLSLNAALKFDQTVVCGRPVRITCALKNGTGSKPKAMPVTSANLKAAAEDNQVESGNVSAAFGNQDASTGEDVLSSRIRRRTCYECGEKGHLSSACPKITTASKAETMQIDNQINGGKNLTAANSKAGWEDYQDESGYYSAAFRNQVTSTAEDALSSKIRRRTCYECGEKGHLSSACPKLATASKAETMQMDSQVDGGKKVTAANFKAAWDDYQVESGNVGSAFNDQVTSSGANALSSKIRRRTCYECGEKGHLSSACPKIAAASKTESIQIDNQMEGGKDASAAAATLKAAPEDTQVVEAAAVVSSSVAEVSSSKIRRRTCYECGERGHLSSSCPKTQAATAPPP